MEQRPRHPQYTLEIFADKDYVKEIVKGAPSSSSTASPCTLPTCTFMFSLPHHPTPQTPDNPTPSTYPQLPSPNNPQT